MLPNDFKHVNRSDSFYFVKDLEKFGIDFNQACELIPNLNNIANLFGVDKNEVIDIIKELHYINRDLFEFTCFPGFNEENILIAEKAIYTSNMKTICGERKEIIKYYNVYLMGRLDSFGKILESLFSKKFSVLYNDENFNEIIPKFPTKFKIEPWTKITDLHLLNENMYKVEYNITCSDIFELMKDENYINTTIVKSKFRFYGIENFYLKLPNRPNCDDSIVIPFEALFKKDWSIIENYDVFSVRLENGGWFKGKQKDSPYFNSDEVNYFKKMFLSF